MSVNITSSSKSTVSSVSSQPRDERGRFTSSEVTNLDSTSKEVKQQILENNKKLHDRDALKECAPFVWNSMEKNQIARDERDHLISVVYASSQCDSYYLFIRKYKSFGFHLNCGQLEEVLSEESVRTVLHNLIIMEQIQKFTF